MRRLPAAIAASLVLAAAAGAQTSPSDTTAAKFARARRLVSDGNGASGRALIDTMLSAATPGTPAYAEALYWRATLAERSADAERDYRLIAVEYATSPRAVDALVRLGQLDLVRGQPAAAREHFRRVLRDHADAPTRARAHYWIARAALDAQDTRGACAALTDAAGAAEADGDLARQISALRARVPRCPAGAPVVAAVPPAARPPAAAPAAAAPTAAAPATTAPAVPAPATGRPGEPRPATPRPATARVFAVQLAAYDTRAGAEAMAARLVRRGIEARVVAGGPTPDAPRFRVRVGRWATRGEAAAAHRELRAKGLAGFVADEPNVEPTDGARP